MYARLSAFVIWSLVAGSAVFWALRLTATAAAVPAYAVATAKPIALRGDLTRLFGAPPVLATRAETVEAPSRFRLVGVMAPKGPVANDAYGLALIAVDGKPAKPFPVGSHVDSDLVLRSVGMRSASIDSVSGAKGVVLEMPALPPPATGTLPPGGALSSGAGATAAPVSRGPLQQGAPLPAVVPPPPLPPQIPGTTQGPGGLPTPDNRSAQ